MVWASSIHFHQKNKSLSDCDENQHQLKHSVLMCACQEETTTKTNIIYILYLYLNEFVEPKKQTFKHFLHTGFHFL